MIGDTRDCFADTAAHRVVFALPSPQQGNYEVALPLDAWEQVVFTYQDATDATSNDGIFRTYVNGQQVFELTDEPISNIGATAARFALFFQQAAESSRNFNGDIGIFRWYLASLTPEQVAQNFENDAAAFGLAQQLTGDAGRRCMAKPQAGQESQANVKCSKLTPLSRA